MTAGAPVSSSRDRRAIAAGLASLVAFLVYFWTLAPSVTSEDSGELIAAATTLGVAHPPGFPAWCLLVHPLTWLPGQAAFWVNLSSAIFAAVTVGLVTLLSVELGASIVASVAAGLTLAFGATFWSQAVITEVYTLNAALLALVLLALVSSAHALDRKEEGARERWARIAATAAGVGLASHYPLTLLVAPAWALYWAMTQGKSGLRLAVRVLPFALLPLALYAYLPWAASRAPLANWGEPATWDTFRDHVLRRAYRSLELEAEVTWADKLAFLQHAGSLAMHEVTPWVGPPLALFGAVVAWARKERRALALLFGVVLLDIPLLIAVLKFRFDHENVMRVNEYYIPAWVALAPVVAFGLSSVAERLSAWTRVRALRFSVLAVPVIPLVASFAENDRSKDTLARTFSLQIFSSLEPNAIYWPSGDYAAFPALYLQAVEHVRPDVLLADYTGKLSPGAKALAKRLDPDVALEDTGRVQLLFATRSGRPLYFGAKSDLRSPELHVAPWGLVYRVERPNEMRPPAPDLTSSPLSIVPPGLVVDDLGRSILGDYHLMRGEALADRGHLEAAKEAWAESERWNEGSKEALNNLGSTLAERGLEDDAVRLFRRAASLSPDYQTPRRNLAMIFRERVAGYEAAVRERPDHAPTWNNLGSARAESGDVEGAIAAFERALAIDRGYALACQNLAELHRRMGSDAAEAARRRAGCP